MPAATVGVACDELLPILKDATLARTLFDLAPEAADLTRRSLCSGGSLREIGLIFVPEPLRDRHILGLGPA